MSVISATQGIREEIATRLNEAESDNTDVYTNWINMSLRDIELDFPDAPFLRTSADKTLSAGTRFYTGILPTNFSKMNDITLPQNNAKIGYVTPEQFDIIRPSASETGNPTLYTLRGNQQNASLEFFPVPGSAFTIHLDYQIQIDPVSAGSSVPYLPTKYYELPILYGESRGLRRRGKYPEAQTIAQEYENLKQKMITDLRNSVTEMRRFQSVREFNKVNKAFDDPIKNMFFGDRNIL